MLFLALAQCSKRPDSKPVASLESPKPASPNPFPFFPHGGLASGQVSLKGAESPDAPAPLLSSFPPAANRVREFGTLSDEARGKLVKLQAEFWSGDDQGRRLEILDEIERSCYAEEVLGFLEKVLSLGDESLRLRAIELLAGNTSAAIIPALEKVLQDSSEQVRLNAPLAAAQVRDDAVVNYFGKVFEDDSDNVRLNALNAVEDQTEDRKIKVFDRALDATHSDVQSAAIDALQLESTPRSVEALFKALDASDPEVSNSARFSINFLLDHEFSTAAEARAWWDENKSKFDQNLVPEE